MLVLIHNFMELHSTCHLLTYRVDGPASFRGSSPRSFNIHGLSHPYVHSEHSLTRTLIDQLRSMEPFIREIHKFSSRRILDDPRRQLIRPKQDRHY